MSRPILCEFRLLDGDSELKAVRVRVKKSSLSPGNKFEIVTNDLSGQFEIKSSHPTKTNPDRVKRIAVLALVLDN